MNFLKNLWILPLFVLLTLQSCDDDDVPLAENEEEVIDEVILTFTPSGANDVVIVQSTDADGEGADPFVTPAINLVANETYTLTIAMNNTAENESISAEVLEEADEHMLFFGFTADLFTSPEGDGNIGEGSRNDAVNYSSSEFDSKGYPLGLTTTWQTAQAATGTFRIVLKHQPNGIKTATSSSSVGETDIDLTWPITIN